MPINKSHIQRTYIDTSIILTANMRTSFSPLTIQSCQSSSTKIITKSQLRLFIVGVQLFKVGFVCIFLFNKKFLPQITA